MSSVVSVENSMRNVGKMWAKCGQDRHKAREVEKRVIMKGLRASIEFAHAPVGNVPVNLLPSKYKREFIWTSFPTSVGSFPEKSLSETDWCLYSLHNKYGGEEFRCIFEGVLLRRWM